VKIRDVSPQQGPARQRSSFFEVLSCVAGLALAEGTPLRNEKHVRKKQSRQQPGGWNCMWGATRHHIELIHQGDYCIA